MLPIETTRLQLRRFVERDLEALVAYRSDPAVARYQSWHTCTPREAKALIRENQEQPPGVPGEWLQVAIALKTDDSLIGDLAIKIQQNDSRQAVIGFTLASAFQNRGYASEAVSAMFDYFFRSMDLHRVSADCDPRNTPSWRLMERLGMRREGHFVRSLWFKGEWADEYFYAILRQEWLKLHGYHDHSNTNHG